MTTEGPLLVLAGAGSGKTRVLTQRIAYLVGVCGIAPEGILAVTFTNKAAGEMRERVEKLLGADAAGVWLSTFHSVCVRILRRDIGHLGMTRGFAIYDEADSLSAVKQALARHRLDPKVVDPRRVRWRIDQWKNAGEDPAAVARAAYDAEARQAADVYATYQRVLADAGALDFGDLLLKTVDLFERFPEVLAHYRRRWQYVLVDEYQDTNRVQYRLVQQLVAEHGNLCVVGDPDQSIYAWRGADVNNILDFERDYPGRGRGEARAQLPLDAADPRGRVGCRLAQRRAQAQRAVHRPRGRRRDPAVRGGRRPRGGAGRRARDRRARARRRPRLRRLRDLLPHQRAVARVRRGAARLRRPLRRGRRRALLRPRRGEGRALVSAARAQSRRRRRAAPDRQQAARAGSARRVSSAPRSSPSSTARRCSRGCTASRRARTARARRRGSARSSR